MLQKALVFSLPIIAGLLGRPALATPGVEGDTSTPKRKRPTTSKPTVPPEPPRHQVHDATAVQSHEATAVEAHEATAVEAHEATAVEAHEATAVGHRETTTVRARAEVEIAIPRPGRFRVSPREYLTDDIGILDLAFSGGVNNAAGAIGGELELRLFDVVGIGAAGGIAPWGLRVTPQLRVYPYTYNSSHAFFVEAGYSYNTGATYEISRGSASQELTLLPAATINAALGLRFQIGPNTFLGLRGGYQLPLGDPAYAATDGSPVNPEVDEGVRSILRPGGFTMAMLFGLAI